jgi:hypothetical protein
MNLGGPRFGVLAAQGQTFLHAQLLAAGVTISPGTRHPCA